MTHRIRAFSDEQVVDYGVVNLVYPPTVGPYDLAEQRRILSRDVFPHASPNDFILCAGPQIMLSLFIVEWSKRVGGINLLVWDRSGGGQYRPKRL